MGRGGRVRAWGEGLGMERGREAWGQRAEAESESRDGDRGQGAGDGKETRILGPDMDGERSG